MCVCVCVCVCVCLCVCPKVLCQKEEKRWGKKVTLPLIESDIVITVNKIILDRCITGKYFCITTGQKSTNHLMCPSFSVFVAFVGGGVCLFWGVKKKIKNMHISQTSV